MESIGKVDICNGVPCLEVRIRGSCSFLKSVYTASANYKDSAVRVIKTKHVRSHCWLCAYVFIYLESLCFLMRMSLSLPLLLLVGVLSR